MCVCYFYYCYTLIGEFETGFEKGGQTREHALLAKTLGKYMCVYVCVCMYMCGYVPVGC